MEESNTLPIVNAIEHLKASNQDQRQRLQKSLRAGLLNVVKSVDRLHATIASSFGNMSFLGAQRQVGEDLVDSGGGTTNEGPHLIEYIQAGLQYNTQKNTGDLETATEAMGSSQRYMGQLFGVMGNMLGSMNKKLSDIAAIEQRMLQLKINEVEKSYGVTQTREIGSLVAESMGTINKTYERQNETQNQSVDLLARLNNIVNEMNGNVERGTFVEQITQQENTRAIEKLNKTEKNQTSWLERLHTLIKTDLSKKLKAILEEFKGGIGAGAGLGGLLGLIAGGPLGGVVGAIGGGLAGGLLNALVGRAALTALLNPYVAAAVGTAITGYTWYKSLTKRTEELMDQYPDMPSTEAATRALGEDVANFFGVVIGRPFDAVTEWLFGPEGRANTEGKLEDYINRLFGSLGMAFGWIQEKLDSIFGTDADEMDRGVIGNAAKRLADLTKSMNESIAGWFDRLTEKLKELYNKYVSPITGKTYTLKPTGSEENMDSAAYTGAYTGSDVPSAALLGLNDKKADTVSRLSRQQAMELRGMATGQSTPIIGVDSSNSGNFSMVGSNNNTHQFFGDMRNNKSNASTYADPHSAFLSRYGLN